MTRNFGNFFFPFWLLFFLFLCHFFPVVVVLYDATIGKLLDYFKGRPIRKAMDIPDEDYIKEHDAFLFYLVTMLKLYAPFGFFFSISRKRKIITILSSIVLSDVLLFYSWGSTGVFYEIGKILGNCVN